MLLDEMPGERADGIGKHDGDKSVDTLRQERLEINLCCFVMGRLKFAMPLERIVAL